MGAAGVELWVLLPLQLAGPRSILRYQNRWHFAFRVNSPQAPPPPPPPQCKTSMWIFPSGQTERALATVPPGRNREFWRFLVVHAE